MWRSASPGDRTAPRRWPPIGTGLNNLGDLLTTHGAIGAGIYGVFNRLLLPFGLHHIVNSLVWFVFGSFQGPAGVVHGDLNRFLAGDPTAGAFMAGFCPVMMFGLPAAALAMWRHARPAQRKLVGGIMLSGPRDQAEPEGGAAPA